MRGVVRPESSDGRDRMVKVMRFERDEREAVNDRFGLVEGVCAVC